MSKLKTLSLFSGIGGFDLGLERTDGFETISMCEIDETCQKVLTKHWPNIECINDIQELQYTENVDVITASWPCQGHSTAGKKRGLDDERSGLWKEVKRLLQETKAGWFIGENSANLRSNGLTEVLQDLWEIGFRDIRWDVLPAEAYGAIHKRERIFIIANSHGIRLDDPTFAPTKEEQIRRSKAWFSFGDRQCPKPSFYRVDDDVSKELERTRKTQVKQYGNSLIPNIVTKIGYYILDKINEV